MSNWSEITLKDYIQTNFESISGDYPHKKILYLDTGSITSGRIQKLQEMDLSNAPSRAKRLVRENDIIYSAVRPNQKHFGFIKNPEDNLVVSTGFIVISCDYSKLFPKYLYYYLTSNRSIEYLHSIAEGSTSAYPSLKPSDIESLKFLLPPLAEQRAIAGILSALDDKIDLLHRQNQTLEALAQTLFRQWFIEEADDDWEESLLPDEFDFTMGLSPPGSSYNENSIGTPMFQGNADFGFRFPKNRIFTTDPKRFAEKFDTLISVRAPVGSQNMAFEKSCIGRGVAAFRYKNNLPYFSYTYYKLNSIIAEIRQFEDSGTVFGSINKSDFETLEITIPPKSLIDKFEQTVNPLDKKIYSNSIQIRTLKKLRDMLLPKLISGEVRVLDQGQGDSHDKENIRN